MSIIKTDQDYVFGGFTAVSWKSMGGFVRDPDAYLFAMSLGIQLHLKNPVGDEAILDYSGYGPSFGYDDIRIHDNSDYHQGMALRNTFLGPYGE